ncbi:MAG: hypothetical protein M3342_12240, partial [Bacteroidota bacterium]|nr:hypothetical protein [Bacteroidota bacterium]
ALKNDARPHPIPLHRLRLQKRFCLIAATALFGFQSFYTFISIAFQPIIDTPLALLLFVKLTDKACQKHGSLLHDSLFPTAVSAPH